MTVSNQPTESTAAKNSAVPENSKDKTLMYAAAATAAAICIYTSPLLVMTAAAGAAGLVYRHIKAEQKEPTGTRLDDSSDKLRGVGKPTLIAAGLALAAVVPMVLPVAAVAAVASLDVEKKPKIIAAVSAVAVAVFAPAAALLATAAIGGAKGYDIYRKAQLHPETQDQKSLFTLVEKNVAAFTDKAKTLKI